MARAKTMDDLASGAYDAVAVNISRVLANLTQAAGSQTNISTLSEAMCAELDRFPGILIGVTGRRAADIFDMGGQRNRGAAYQHDGVTIFDGEEAVRNRFAAIIADGGQINGYPAQDNIAFNGWRLEVKVEHTFGPPRQLIEALTEGNGAIPASGAQRRIWVGETFVSCKQEDRAKVMRELKRLKLTGDWRVVDVGDQIDIVRTGYSRGAALAEVCKKLGVDPKRVVAIGEHQADAEMDQVAGAFVATNSASDEVKTRPTTIMAPDGLSNQQVAEMVMDQVDRGIARSRDIAIPPGATLDMI